MNSENVNIASNKAYRSGVFCGVNVNNQHQVVNEGNGAESSTPTGFSNGTMANTKEKTPMCLINELARFNKVIHRYRLTNESGPAHKKTFTVMLELGPEEKYNASGQSIKKAQHAAAEVALIKTLYKHPPPKSLKTYRTAVEGDPGASNFHGAITPTVELNALAMKRGEPAVYQIVDAPITPGGFHPPPPPHGRGNFHVPPNFNFRGMYNQRFHHQNNPSHHHYGNSRYPPPIRPVICCVSLQVGSREFIGEGKSVQAARHNAAGKALAILKNLPCPELTNATKVCEDNESDDSPNNDILDPNAELKSPISLVHEVALKLNLNVTFEVVDESGPPHMRTFVTKCCVGEHQTEGEGNGKKISKKRAAENMLEELKKLPPMPVTPSQKFKSKNPVIKKKSKNLIKEQKAHPEYGQNINPISRLIQIQQAKKEKEPMYTLLAEDGLPRRRQFVIQVEVCGQKCSGNGPNKKLAKRSAAEAMLSLMGYSKILKPPQKPAIKSVGNDMNAVDEKQRKVKFIEHESGERRAQTDTNKYGGCQIAPGLILMHSDNKNGDSASLDGLIRNSEISGQSSIRADSAQAIAKELLHEGVSMTAEAIRKSNCVPSTNDCAVSPKQKLMYLAEVLDFTVTFTDFPKANGSEVLSLVTLSTKPPEVSHGAGPTLEESHNQAAIQALQRLANSGLDHVAGTAISNNAKTSYNEPLVHPATNQKMPNVIPCLQND